MDRQLILAIEKEIGLLMHHCEGVRALSCGGPQSNHELGLINRDRWLSLHHVKRSFCHCEWVSPANRSIC